MAVAETTLAAEVITNLIENSFQAVMNGASSKAKSVWSKIFQDFEPYMRDIYNRNSRVKILCQKEKSIDLYDIYVNSNFKCENNLLSDEDLIHQIVDGENVIINGNGGAGKTFFMRHLWMTIFKGDTRYTPIFLELRKLNEITDANIESFIRASISRSNLIPEDVFSSFCNNGKFLFIFDGFDEINQEKRESIQEQILNISYNYANCRFVVSSRYEKRFSGWQNFRIYESSPFDIDQVKELISRVPFEPESRETFLKKITQGFYLQNQQFLSNPLLAIMMMMTFKENMSMPSKGSIFYDQAFNTLYTWHDATKLYERKKHLDMIEFQRCFGIFCLLSYCTEEYEFTIGEILDLIAKSNKICGISVNPAEILSDFEESVNLIRQDGLKYVFIHRSFQEYFSAYALANVVPEKSKLFFEKIDRRTTDNVILFCYEMQKGLVIQNFIEPKYKTLCKSSKIFRQNGNDPFPRLENAGFSYLFGCYIQNTDKRISVGIGVKLQDGNLEFLEMVSKIMIGDISSNNRTVRDIFIDHRLFSALENVDPRGITSKDFELEIFAKGIFPQFSIYRLEHEARGREEYYTQIMINDRDLTEQIERELLKNKNIFDDIERNFANYLKRIHNWIKNEIATDKQKGKSIEELLLS